MEENNSDPEDGKSASDMIQRIKAGALDPGVLNMEQRQMCVEELYFQSVPLAGIAQFLKVVDRTIRRDMEDIRRRNVLAPDPDFARQMAFEFVQYKRIHRNNLMKLARNPEASTGERAQAEFYASMVGSDLITKLQSLGHLPKSADALLVMQKQEDHQSDSRVAGLFRDFDAMHKLEENPEKAAKLMEIKNNLKKENSNENPGQ